MSDISVLYNRQKQLLNGALTLKTLKKAKKTKLTKEYLSRLGVEVSEIFDASKRKDKEATLSSAEKKFVAEELVEYFKCLLNLLILQGLSIEKFERLFHEKSDIEESQFRYLARK